MNPRRVAGTLVVLTLSLLGLTVTPGTLPAAQAVTGSPPVTVPDAVTVFPGSFGSVQPLNNDTDPDNDLLAVCRVDPHQVSGMLIVAQDADLGILVKPRVEPGVYTITYFACDYSYLVPGTVTITVEKAPDIEVQKIPGRPGHLRVTNPADYRIRFLWGSEQARRPDGDVKILRHSSAVITVKRDHIIWVAFNRRVGIVDQGRVSGIDLRRVSGAPAADQRVPAAALKAWQTR